MEISSIGLIIAYLGSNLVGASMAWISLKRPVIGRFMFALLFLWAGQFNWRACRSDPQVYVGYGDFSVIPFLKTFIEGWFAENVTMAVSGIALGQVLIGLSMLAGGWLTRVGAWGGILFLAAISPLGMGSAFPATVLMALGCYFIYKAGYSGGLFTHLKIWLITGKETNH